MNLSGCLGISQEMVLSQRDYIAKKFVPQDNRSRGRVTYNLKMSNSAVLNNIIGMKMHHYFTNVTQQRKPPA